MKSRKSPLVHARQPAIPPLCRNEPCQMDPTPTAYHTSNQAFPQALVASMHLGLASGWRIFEARRGYISLSRACRAEARRRRITPNPTHENYETNPISKLRIQFQIRPFLYFRLVCVDKTNPILPRYSEGRGQLVPVAGWPKRPTSPGRLPAGGFSRPAQNVARSFRGLHSPLFRNPNSALKSPPQSLESFPRFDSLNYQHRKYLKKC
jgi:hypothetical protein